MSAFKGSIAVTDFASQDKAGSPSPREASLSTLQVFGLDPPLQSPPPQSLRERARKWQRSRSAPHRQIPFGKPSRRSTFEISPPPSKFQSSHREIQTQDDSDRVSQLRKEVISLFISITRAGESPLQCSQSSASRRPKSVDLRTLLATECPSERQPPTKDHPMKRDFDSLEWFRQKDLLNRELRRLLSWNLEASTDGLSEEATQSHQARIVADAFASIGKALIELLADDMLYEGGVARIERLIRNVKHGVPTNGDSHGEPEGSPFDRIQTAINYLFEPEPLRRKNITKARDLVAPSIPPSSQFDHTGIDDSSKKAQKVDHLQRPQKPRFALEDEDNDLAVSDSLRPDPTQDKSVKKASDVAISTESKAGSEHDEHELESKIVLEIANRPDAFQKPSNLQKTEAFTRDQKDQRPGIKRLKSSEFPSEPSEISAVIDSLAALNINSQFSSAAITEELLTLARPKRGASSTAHSSEASQVLCRFDQILGLIASLPSWKIYICVDHKQKDHAKSAMSLIYFSLLEETISCAVSVSEALQEELNDADVPTEVKRNVEFFCACIQRLSSVQQSVKGTFDALQHQLDRVVSKLSLLDTLIASMPCAASQENAGPTDDSPSVANVEDTTAAANSGDEIFFHEYEPLALACYLTANSGGHGYVRLSDEGDFDDLEAMSVKSLFSLVDAEAKEEENNQVE
ncbi:hypothetical protein FB567DRAFT_91094 [Paraphoma chrysanthemicola]|uniref:Uncharacterized protein n=1 Tax=Paraphoma chrysanthemicola TaxID=798071 RepID=A0A8K0VWN5_9PLEO|nr:hypothetical protein FB567DRAFT_91094 [Paraphoma chrysanthemicola]